MPISTNHIIKLSRFHLDIQTIFFVLNCWLECWWAFLNGNVMIKGKFAGWLRWLVRRLYCLVDMEVMIGWGSGFGCLFTILSVIGSEIFWWRRKGNENARNTEFKPKLKVSDLFSKKKWWNWSNTVILETKSLMDTRKFSN